MDFPPETSPNLTGDRRESKTRDSKWYHRLDCNNHRGSFGEPTDGRSTSNRTFELEDGALLFLTGATFADRTGRVYAEPIQPDTEIPLEDTDSPLVDEPVVTAALEWLKAQPACRSE